MSDMSLAIAVRFNQGLVTRDTSLLEKLESIFGKAPDDVDEYNGVIEHVEYDAEKNNGFTVNIMSKTNVLYIDYMISEERECYDINLSLTKDDLDAIVEKAKLLGIKTDEYHLKVLYYYNGGCAGLSEVE